MYKVQRQISYESAAMTGSRFMCSSFSKNDSNGFYVVQGFYVLLKIGQ
jgi:hypothetical protein